MAAEIKDQADAESAAILAEAEKQAEKVRSEAREEAAKHKDESRSKAIDDAKAETQVPHLVHVELVLMVHDHRRYWRTLETL